MKEKITDKGCRYKGKFIPAFWGLYWNTSKEFFRGGLPEISRTLKCDDGASVCIELLDKIDMAKKYRIRKLTPTECYRLMGVREGDVQKLRNCGVSESQQYKMAGNSIVVDVLMGIFEQMFDPKYVKESSQLSLW